MGLAVLALVATAVGAAPGVSIASTSPDSPVASRPAAPGPAARVEPAVLLPPVQSLAVTSTTFHAIDLSWSLDRPGARSAGVSGFVVRRALGGTAPAGPADGTLVTRLDRWQHTVTDTGLPPGTTASYSVFTVGAHGRPGPRASVTATTVSHDGSSGISGRVVDSGGRGIGGIRVIVGNNHDGTISDAYTNAEGRYLQTGLAAGSWFVCFAPPQGRTTPRAPTGFIGECYDNTPISYQSAPRHPTLVQVRTGHVAGPVNAVLGLASSLSGRLVGADGTAVKHATVAAYGLTTMDEAAVAVGPDGRYTLGGLPPDRYQICITPGAAAGSGSPTGWVRQCPAATVRLAATSARSVPDIVLARGAAVAGTLHDAAGAPVGGVTVAVSSDDGSGNGGSTATDARGHYLVGNLAPGVVSVCFDGRNTVSGAAPAGYVPVCDGGRPYDPFQPPPADIAIRAGRATVVDLELARGAGLRGTVTDGAGSPVTDVSIALDGFYPEQGYADADGHFLVTGLPAGAHSVCFGVYGGELESGCYRDATGPADATPVALRAGRVIALDMVLVGGTGVSGTVLDESGAPIAGVSVDVESFDFSGAHGYDTTDDAGHYRVTGLPPGDYRVGFEPSAALGAPTGYIPESYDDHVDGLATPVHVSRGSTATADAVLAVGAAVSGTVTDEQGNPVADTSVYVKAQGATFSTGVYTDGGGHYRVPGVPAGDAEICFYPATWHPDATPLAAECWDDQPIGSGTPAHLVTGRELTADAVLAATAGVAGRVTDPAGGPMAYATVELRPIDGFDVVTVNADETGRYLISAVPGVYSVCFSSYDSGPSGTGYLPQCWDHLAAGDAPTPVAVSPSQVTRGIDGVLTEGAGASGHVDALGAPASDVSVTLTSPDGTYVGSGYTDSQGDWTASALPAGPVVVCFQPPWWGAPALAAQCYDNQPPDPMGSGVKQVLLVPGQLVAGIDAVLTTA